MKSTGLLLAQADVRWDRSPFALSTLPEYPISPGPSCLPQFPITKCIEYGRKAPESQAMQQRSKSIDHVEVNI